MSKLLKTLVSIIGVVVLAQSNLGLAIADNGPLLSPQGGTVQPSASTVISMESEKVVLTYDAPTTISLHGIDFTAMPAHVTAEFKMKNQGSSTENIQVFFPADDSAFVGGVNEGSLTNFTVNGQQLSDIVDVPAGFDAASLNTEGNDPPTGYIKAYQWDQAFPVGDTTITVTYDTSSVKGSVYPLTYVLGTGRSWSGPIKSGEIDFILPESIPDYAVSDLVPMRGATSLNLPRTISGNTIKITFSNLEPKADAAIYLGIADFDILHQIEQFKATNPQTFESVLGTASSFRKAASGGSLCTFCIEPSAQMANDNYMNALDLATSQDQLNTTLLSFAYGDNSGEHSVNELTDFFKFYVEHPDCDNTTFSIDNKCTSALDNPTVPFILAGATGASAGSVRYSDFLAKYACRMRPYDLDTSIIVESYIGKQLASCDVASSTEPSQDTVSSISNNSQSNLPLRIGLAIGGVGIVAALVIAMVIAKKRRQTKPGENQKDKEQ